MAFRATPTAGMPEAAVLLDQQKSATDQNAPWRMRRGWLVRRMLLAADLLALTAAFVVVEVSFQELVGAVGPGVEAIIFLGLLPVWVLAAKLYGLYDRDEERATSFDRRRGRQRLSSRHGRRLALLRHLVARRPFESEPGKAHDVLVPRSGVHRGGAICGQDARTAAIGLCPERADRWRGGGRAVDRPQAPPAS